MPRETRIALGGQTVEQSPLQTPNVAVSASQAVIAPEDKLARLGASLQRNIEPLAQRVEFETREQEEEYRLKQDFEGKLYGVEVQTRAMQNIDAWKNSPNGIEEAKKWHMDAINEIADEDQRRAASGYIMAAYQNVAASLRAHYKEQDNLKLESGAQRLLAGQAQTGVLFSVEGANDAIEYISKLLGDRRKAGQLVVNTMIEYAQANPDKDAASLSSDIFSQIKIDDVPLEHIYKSELTQARDAVASRWKKLNADALEARDYEITKQLQDQLAAGTLSDKTLDLIANKYPDFSKDKLLSLRGQMLQKRIDQAEEISAYVDFQRGNYTKSYLSDKVARKNMELFAQEVNQRTHADGTPWTTEEKERAIIDKGRDMGTGYLYEPWKKELEHSEPGGARYAETAALFQRIHAYDPSYAESLVSDDKAAQYHAYNHLVSQGVPVDQAVEIVRTGATAEGLQEAKTRMDFREDGPFMRTVSSLGGNNERYVYDNVMKTMQVLMASGVPQDKVRDLVETRFKAVHKKIGNSWVYTGGYAFPADFEDAADYVLTEELPKILEGAGKFNDPNGYTIGTIPASLGLSVDEAGNADRVVVVLDSSFQPVMLNGKPLTLKVNALADDYRKKKIIREQERQQKLRKRLEEPRMIFRN